MPIDNLEGEGLEIRHGDQTDVEQLFQESLIEMTDNLVVYSYAALNLGPFS